MMAKSFKFFESYLEATRTLSVKDRGDFLFAIAQYGINGEEVPLKKSLQPLWLLVKPNLDKSRKYQESGEKGGRPKKPPLQKSETLLSENEKPDMDMDKDKEMKVEEDKDREISADAASASALPTFDIFADFSNGDSELLQALRAYDQMRREKCKTLTDTMRRSLCQQLDDEFQPCEWVEIVKQATRQGWLKFYPLDKDKPTTTPPLEESSSDQLTRILNNLKNMNGGI